MTWLSFSLSGPGVRYDVGDHADSGWSIRYDLTSRGADPLELPRKGGDLLDLPGSLFIRAGQGRSGRADELGKVHHIPARGPQPRAVADRGDGARFSIEIRTTPEEARELALAEQEGRGPKSVGLRVGGLVQDWAPDGGRLRWDDDRVFLPVENAFFGFSPGPGEGSRAPSGAGGALARAAPLYDAALAALRRLAEGRAAARARTRPWVRGALAAARRNIYAARASGVRPDDRAPPSPE